MLLHIIPWASPGSALDGGEESGFCPSSSFFVSFSDSGTWSNKPESTSRSNVSFKDLSGAETDICIKKHLSA